MFRPRNMRGCWTTDGALIKAPVAVTLDVSGVNLRATGQITREGAAVGAGPDRAIAFCAA